MATAQELNFAPSSNIRQCACIQIINDAIAESSEDFTVGLRSTNGEVLQGITTATVTILDDDDGIHYLIVLVHQLMHVVHRLEIWYYY